MNLVPLKITAAVVAAGATLALGLARLGWPLNFWVDKSSVLVAALVYLALFSMFETSARTVAAHRAKVSKKREQVRKAAEETLKGTLVLVHRLAKDIDWTQIGLHLFLVKESRRWKPWEWRNQPWPWWRYEVQEHVVRVKMSQYPPSTHITWVKGKGVIGRSWDRKIFVPCDLRAAFRPYMTSTRDEWDRLSAAQRFGLEFEEFEKTKEHAGAILAAPILQGLGGGATYMGCVSLDAPGDCFASLNTFEVKELLQLAATTVRNASIE